MILNFVNKLFYNKEYNVILMITNRLSKMHHYILCTTNETEIIAKHIAKFLIQNV
jgi:hypothetical protein